MTSCGFRLRSSWRRALPRASSLASSAGHILAAGDPAQLLDQIEIDQFAVVATMQQEQDIPVERLEDLEYVG